MQGRLTLLLGPPSCGKSTLLKVLSGRLKDTSIMQVRIKRGRYVSDALVAEIRVCCIGRALKLFRVMQGPRHVINLSSGTCIVPPL